MHQPSTRALRSSSERLRGYLPADLLGIAFVVLWSSGYPAARIALDHSAPFTLLVLRFGGAGLILAAIVGLSRAAWPRGRAAVHSALVGTLQLGLTFGAPAKFVRRYADLGEVITSAVKSYRDDVKQRNYPGDPESYHLPKETMLALQAIAERKRAMTV